MKFCFPNIFSKQYWFPTRIASSTTGSLYFNGSANCTVFDDNYFRLRTGDFTIEWFQNMTINQPNPPVFAIGSLMETMLGVSIGTDLHYWSNGVSQIISPITIAGNWAHYAVCRSGSTVLFFENGIQIGSLTDSTDYNTDNSSLMIGGVTNLYFTGYITNFRVLKDVALYTADFTVPTEPLPNIAGTYLLLLAQDADKFLTDSSVYTRPVTTPTSSPVVWSSLSPF